VRTCCLDTHVCSIVACKSKEKQSGYQRLSGLMNHGRPIDLVTVFLVVRRAST
jgi:hypothetical protein